MSVALSGLVDAVAVAPTRVGPRAFWPRYQVIDAARRDEIVTLMRAGVVQKGDGLVEPRTSLLLAMTPPTRLLKVVAPERSARGAARRRISQILDGTPVEPIQTSVRRRIAGLRFARLASWLIG